MLSRRSNHDQIPSALSHLVRRPRREGGARTHSVPGSLRVEQQSHFKLFRLFGVGATPFARDTEGCCVGVVFIRSRCHGGSAFVREAGVPRGTLNSGMPATVRSRSQILKYRGGGGRGWSEIV